MHTLLVAEGVSYTNITRGVMSNTLISQLLKISVLVLLHFTALK